MPDPLTPELLKAADNPPGLVFFDQASNRTMKYVYPDTQHWCAGWILYKHPDGQWVTLRKATVGDISKITEAVVSGHHTEAK